MARRLPVVANNESPCCAVCSTGGARSCCQNFPGTYHPEDLGAPADLRDRLVAGFTTHALAVDWWEADGKNPKIYFVRPAVTGCNLVMHPGWYGECSLLDAESGCRLPFDARPLQCRALVPCSLAKRETAGGCHLPKWASKLAAAKWWLPYQDVVVDAARIARATEAA